MTKQTLHLNQRPPSTSYPPEQQENFQAEQTQPQNQPQQAQSSQATPLVTSQEPPGSDFIGEAAFFKNYEKQKESTQQQQTVSDPVNVPEGTAPPIPETIYAGGAPVVESARPEMTESEARKQTENMMYFRQTVQSFAIAMYADGSFNAAEQYNYSPQAFNKLVDAYSPLIQQARIKFPPFWNILAAEVVCSGPVFGLMAQNRKNRKEIEKLRKTVAAQQQQIATMANARKDTKTAWEIDQNGYFVRTPAGTYIPQGKRQEKPTPNEENYQLLVKHNGKETVDRAFNIG